jgi:hypothetical protein
MYRRLEDMLAVLCLLFIFHGSSTEAIPLYRTGALLKQFTFAAAPSLATKQSKQSQAPWNVAKGDHNDITDPQNRRSVYLIVSQRWSRFLYILSAVNPFLAVFFNDYSQMCDFIPHIQTAKNVNVLSRTYETLFFFARLRPRVSFAIGAAFRALQLTTAFQYIFDPSVGVGFGLNLLCLYAKSRWPATIVLGWALSKPVWKVLGACPPTGLPVPIRISLKEISKEAPVASKGYRIGL